MSATPTPTLLENRKLKAALWYASLGWRVHPCKPKGKEPLTTHGLRDATTDTEQIRKWWTQWPNANVAIAIPGGYVVIDIDGAEGLLALKANGYSLPATARVRTAKGAHHWYRLPPGVVLKNAVRTLPCVDLRTAGGYVIAPPSVHPTGSVYIWEGNPATEIAPAPDWIMVLTESANGARKVRQASEWADVIGAQATEGHRHETLLRVSGLLFRRLDAPIALALAIAWHDARCTPPLPESEAARILDAALDLERRRRARESGGEQ